MSTPHANDKEALAEEKKAAREAAPHVIHAHAVYNIAQARRALGLSKATLNREIRLSRLRVSKRGGMYMILGAWLLEWIEAGEVHRRRPAAALNGSQTNGDTSFN